MAISLKVYGKSKTAPKYTTYNVSLFVTLSSRHSRQDATLSVQQQAKAMHVTCQHTQCELHTIIQEIFRVANSSQLKETAKIKHSKINHNNLLEQRILWPLETTNNSLQVT